MHRRENLPARDAVRDQNPQYRIPVKRLRPDQISVCHARQDRINGMYLKVGFRQMRAKTRCLSGAGHRVPLVAIAPCIQGKAGVRIYRRFNLQHARLAIGVVKSAICEKAVIGLWPLRRGQIGIIHTCKNAQIQIARMRSCRRVQRDVFGKDVSGCLERKTIGIPHAFRHITDDLPIRPCATGCRQKRTLPRYAAL